MCSQGDRYMYRNIPALRPRFQLNKSQIEDRIEPRRAAPAASTPPPQTRIDRTPPPRPRLKRHVFLTPRNQPRHLRQLINGISLLCGGSLLATQTLLSN
ncbi:hypothetical protein J6590_023365 [Homalodisca vitripennis]|nr:hypothetical protein J6590_023365 [Homalodisca vitripennis]